MSKRNLRLWAGCLALPLLLADISWGQSFNALVSGTVSDPTGAVIPNAELTLKAVATGATAKTTSNERGLYAFPNLPPGAYELSVSAKGFRDYVQRGIAVNMNDAVRADVKLEIGTAAQTIEVAANASPLNYQNGTVKQSITPHEIQELPLIVGGAVRSAAAFVILQPGVTTGGQANPFDARINGGLQSGDEAVLDGVTLQEGLLSQSGQVAIFTDFPVSPAAVEELSVLTSNYHPKYGNTTSAVITAVTKSGTDALHGSAYEFLRNTSLNARQFGVSNRPKDIEHDFGANIGGPGKVPLFWSGDKKSYFFVNFEGFRFAGATVTPILSVPTAKERSGDFSDWVDSSGRLIPVYDPATTRVNPNFNPSQPVGANNLPFLRDEFMGCDGRTPNVVCPSDPRLQNSLAQGWLKFVPLPNIPGAGPTNNFAPPVPISTIAFANSDAWDVRFDQYYRDKDHYAAIIHYRGTHPAPQSLLPPQISSNGFRAPNYSYVDRLNWDHTFSPTKLNNFNFGYLDLLTGGVNITDKFVSAVPQIKGVFSHTQQSAIRFQNFTGYGANGNFLQTRPDYVLNDTLTWVHKRHTFEFGGEYRNIGLNTKFNGGNSSGTFNFSQLNTGLLGINSGNDIASFLLGAVGSANETFYTTQSSYARADSFAWFAADTWKATPKLSVNYGVRWDMNRPAVEKFNRLSFFDPLGANPGAANRPGRLAFAGSGFGAASFGRRRPEFTYTKAFAPRLGIAYSLNDRTVVRTGYGIFFDQAFYPGWGGGLAQDGFNASPAFSSSNGGITPAFLLQDGFPQTFPRPPFIDPSFNNGQGAPLYRPFDANRLPFSQQWNLTIEHQFTDDLYISAAYVGNKGTRLPSQTAPLNALNPSLLSLGPRLFDQFTPGETSLDGVPVPYPRWIEQLRACPPTVAQALLPYPQYCGNIFGLNENAGNSTYHSFQLKAEKRFSHGTWLLASYTVSKLIADSDNTQSTATTWSGAEGSISPFERERNKSLAGDDVPQVLSASLIYELPVGPGQRLLNHAGPLGKLLGGWELSTIFRASSGIPFFFRSSQCTVPSQFAARCIPGQVRGASPFLQSGNSFDPSKGPLLNRAAFESANGFNFYLGQGPRISNLRQPGYHNQDFALMKNTRLAEKVSLQIRAETFNLWNWHTFTSEGTFGGGSAFITNVANPNFGRWNGSVSAPRNIQLSAQITF